MKIIGMVHLGALPSYPDCNLNKVMLNAIADAKALKAGGVDAILVENYDDDPHRKTCGPETVAAMTLIVKRIVEETKLPVGVCVLFNDYKAALAIAHSAGASFVRVPVFVDTVMTACGVIEGEPYDVLAYRKSIGADAIKIYADVQVKHAAMLASRPLEESAKEAIGYGADGIIITGKHTGDAPVFNDLQKARKACPKAFILVGSGTTPKNVKELAKYADSAIVGTYFKEKGKVREKLVKKLVKMK